MAALAMPLAVADEPAQDAVAGNALVLAASESLYQQTGLEAKVRQRATVFGQLLSGAGMYVQARDENRLLVRFEFQLQIADQRRAVLQINDGSVLWIRRDFNQLQSQAFVDLRKLREGLNSGPGADIQTLSPVNPMLAVGGIGQLLHGLSKHFEFADAKATEVASIPMWEVTGAWKREQLLTLLPDARAQIEAGTTPVLTRLPSHLPTTVKLTLGRDRNFPLFPYRIEFGRLQPAMTPAVPGASQAQTVKPMVTMELFEVRRRTDLPRDLFVYSPGDQNVEDETELYLRRLQTPHSN